MKVCRKSKTLQKNLYADEPLADQELLREYNKQRLDEELRKKLEAQIANRDNKQLKSKKLLID